MGLDTLLSVIFLGGSLLLCHFIRKRNRACPQCNNRNTNSSVGNLSYGLWSCSKCGQQWRCDGLGTFQESIAPRLN